MDKKCFIKFRYWLLPLCFFLMFVIVSTVVCNFHQVTYYDIQIIKFVQKIFASEHIDFFAKISCFYYMYSRWIIFFALLFLLKKKDYGIAVMYVFCCFSSFEFTMLAKDFFHRIRPPFELQIIEHPDDFSFPSGHSIDIMFLLGFLIYIILKHVENKILKYALSGVFVLIILLVGLSRLVLGVHYPTDVLAGFIFGLFFISCVWVCDR